MTSSINCKRSTWLRRASALLALLAATATAGSGQPERGRGGDIEQAWLRLAPALSPLDPEALRERTDEAIAVAQKQEVRRLTPFALALVAAARTQTPARAQVVLAQALRLDADSPEVAFSLATVQLRRGMTSTGLGTLMAALANLVHDSRLRSLVPPSALLAAVATVLGLLVLWSLLAIRSVFARLWHDLEELGGSLRLTSSSLLLAIFVVGLPIFISFDPAWLLLWMFAICWAYFSLGRKLVGLAAMLFVAAAPTLVEVALRDLTHPPNPILQAADALANGRYEPQTIEAVSTLSDVFGDDATYHRLAGDSFRQYGLLESAAASYREGLRLAPRDGALMLDLGTVSYLDGDYNAAVQWFQSARNAGFDPLVVSYDLSFAFSQTYRFRESDEMKAAARRIDEPRLAALVAGREGRQILPLVTSAEAEALVQRKDPLVLINRSLAPPPLARERTMDHPLTIGTLLALLLAIGHYLIRQHTTGLASACLKCGRPFCHRCKLSHESQTYCTQCINIFLKKDSVALGTQMAKRRRMRQRQRFLAIEHRLADLLLPGLGLANTGHGAMALPLMAVGALCLGCALIWLPYFIGPALMAAPVWPLQAACGAVWLVAAVTSQLIATGRD
jgi:tetratricopeptide (TPR) repeat protein